MGTERINNVQLSDMVKKIFPYFLISICMSHCTSINLIAGWE
jgi:hypothetical protein